MNVIIDFFTSIGETIVMLVDYLLSIIRDLVYMVQLMGQIVLYLPDYFAWLPSVIVTFVLLIISIVVIYKIIGREG